jgi:hypothetical protein
MRDRVATSAGPRLTRSSFAFPLSRPATSPRTAAAGACTRNCWCGRPSSRPCPARRSESSPGSGGRSQRLCSPRTLNSVTGTARLAADDIATEVGRLRDEPGEGWCPSGGPGRCRHRSGPDRRIPPVRHQPGHPGRRNPYFTPLTEPLDLRLTESRTFNLLRRLPSLPALGVRVWELGPGRFAVAGV